MSGSSGIKFDADSPRAKQLHQEVFDKVREIWDPTKPDEAVSSVAQYTVALAARGTDRKKLQNSLAGIVGKDASSLLLDWLVRHIQQNKKELMSSKAPAKPAKAVVKTEQPAVKEEPAAKAEAVAKAELAVKTEPAIKREVTEALQKASAQQPDEAEVDDVEALIREGQEDYEEELADDEQDEQQQQSVVEDTKPQRQTSQKQPEAGGGSAGNGNRPVDGSQQQSTKPRMRSAIQWAEPTTANGSHEAAKSLTAQEARRLRFGGGASTGGADRPQDKASDKGREAGRVPGDREAGRVSGDRGWTRDREREHEPSRRSRSRTRSPPRDHPDVAHSARIRERDMHRGPPFDRDDRPVKYDDWDRPHPPPHAAHQPWGSRHEDMHGRDWHVDEWGPERDAYSRDRGRPHERPGPWGPERLPSHGQFGSCSPGREPHIEEHPAAVLSSPRQRLRSVVSGSLDAGEGVGRGGGGVGEEPERHVDRAAGAGRILGQTLVRTLVDHGGSSIFARLGRRLQPGDAAPAAPAAETASQPRPSVFDRLRRGAMGSKRRAEEEEEEQPASDSTDQEPQQQPQEAAHAYNPPKLRRTEGSQSIGSALVSAVSGGERGIGPTGAAAAVASKPGNQRQASMVAGAIQAARMHHAKQVQKQPTAGAAATRTTSEAAAAAPTGQPAAGPSTTAAQKQPAVSKPQGAAAPSAAGTVRTAPAPAKPKSELDEIMESLRRKEAEIARMKSNLNMQQMMPSILQPQATPAASAAAAQQAAARRAEAAAAAQADAAKRVEADRRSVVIHNLPPQAANNDALMQYFGRCGPIARISILTPTRDPHTNALRGSAYIEFMELAGKQAACGLNGSHFMEQVIRVLSKPVALTSSARTTPQLGGGAVLTAPAMGSMWQGAGVAPAMAAHQMQGANMMQGGPTSGQPKRLAEAPALHKPMVWRRPDGGPAGTQAQA